jgi:hypothetical protein
MSNPAEIALVEQRTYALVAGSTLEYLRIYQSEGLAIQLATLGRMVGYYSVEVGSLNTIVHLWAFTSYEDRDARRQRMASNPAWKAYWAKVRPLIQSQQSVLLKPAPFFLSRLRSMVTDIETSTLAS